LTAGLSAGLAAGAGWADAGAASPASAIEAAQASAASLVFLKDSVMVIDFLMPF